MLALLILEWVDRACPGSPGQGFSHLHAAYSIPAQEEELIGARLPASSLPPLGISFFFSNSAVGLSERFALPTTAGI